jgi:hypothetical protein
MPAPKVKTELPTEQSHTPAPYPEPAKEEVVTLQPATFEPPTPPPEPVKRKLVRLRPETFIPTAWAVKNYE